MKYTVCSYRLLYIFLNFFKIWYAGGLFLKYFVSLDF